MSEVSPMRRRRAGHRPFCYCCNGYIPVERVDEKRELRAIIEAETQPDAAHDWSQATCAHCGYWTPTIGDLCEACMFTVLDNELAVILIERSRS